MDLEKCWGYEIFLQRHRWEVYTPDGILLADGRGGLPEARAWILQWLLRLACEQGMRPPTQH